MKVLFGFSMFIAIAILGPILDVAEAPVFLSFWLGAMIGMITIAILESIK